MLALRRLADYSDIRGDESQADALRAAASHLAQLAPEELRRFDLELEHHAAPELRSIDPHLVPLVVDMAARGIDPILAEHMGTLPAYIRRLFAQPDIDPSDVAFLARHLGIATVGDLSWAIDDGLARSLREIGPKKSMQIGQALASVKAERRRIPLGRAHARQEAVVAVLSNAGIDATASGSLRRFDATVGDIEVLAVSSNPPAAVDAFVTLPDVSRVLVRTETKAIVLYERDEMTLRAVKPEIAGPALIHHTGSSAHADRLRRYATTKGYVLGPDMFRGATRYDSLDAPTEAFVYETLGLPFIAPELREGAGEIEAARSGTLPTLVDAGDMRGDLHLHTTWSDGRDSIEDMARACLDLGYEYLAITDHSRASTVANGLDVDRLRRQRDAVDEVRRSLPGITILHGSEVDILPDGSLDFPDDALAELDVVLASLHHAAGHVGDALTRRYLAAMRHPLVNIITHPTNRIVGQRDGYVLDVDALIAGALETGTLLEIDGAPSHIDMDGAMARRAVDAGVMVSIDSDGHRAELLGQQMRFGVHTARRGWVTARQVINTRPLAEVRAILRRKRDKA